MWERMTAGIKAALWAFLSTLLSRVMVMFGWGLGWSYMFFNGLFDRAWEAGLDVVRDIIGPGIDLSTVVETVKILAYYFNIPLFFSVLIGLWGLRLQMAGMRAIRSFIPGMGSW